MSITDKIRDILDSAEPDGLDALIQQLPYPYNLEMLDQLRKMLLTLKHARHATLCDIVHCAQKAVVFGTPHNLCEEHKNLADPENGSARWIG